MELSGLTTYFLQIQKSICSSCVRSQAKMSMSTSLQYCSSKDHITDLEEALSSDSSNMVRKDTETKSVSSTSLEPRSGLTVGSVSLNGWPISSHSFPSHLALWNTSFQVCHLLLAPMVSISAALRSYYQTFLQPPSSQTFQFPSDPQSTILNLHPQ